VVQEQVYKSPQVQFDARKFAWIGNMNSDYDACVVGAASPVKTVALNRSPKRKRSSASIEDMFFPRYRPIL
jgi:hypothetical protein